ncbi:MAG: hypothetical protein JJU05_17215 [Verrucomicrobia bacterium]|nr:hypothetical protein [Verrucomicrobiota bacterium]MCH8527185.1 hypothetical protein [Kiritimatiellia bacterium]
MKIRISKNGKHISTGEVTGNGHLGAHVNLTHRTSNEESVQKLSLHGYSTDDSSFTEFKTWKGACLKEGDVLTIEIMPKCPADAPTEVKRSDFEVKIDKLSDEDADSVLNATKSCSESLMKMLAELKVEGNKEVALGIGKVLAEIYSSIEKPVYRKYPAKRPEGLNDLPL